MRKLFTFMVAVLLTATLWAQSPEKMSYQAVIRDASDNLVTSQQIGMQISILQGSASGTAVYVETQTPTTNANGLVSIEIGTGTTSDDFSSINWANGPYFIKTETDPSGSTSYTITGTSQLLSVPYALYAKTAETVSGTITETDPVYGASVASGINGTDTTNWNNKLDSYTEIDPVFASSVASGITATDTTNWNNKLNSYTETDPSVPTGTRTGEMQYWNGSEWINVAIGREGQVLTFTGSMPTWKYINSINDSVNVVQLDAADEDYIDFDTLNNFTNQSDWCIIEKVKMPSGTSTSGGWHFFRGKAWEDKEGDIAISISNTRIHAWCQKSGWKSVVYDGTFNEEQWYTICFQYNSTNQTLNLYVNGDSVAQTTNVAPQNDSENNNKLFFGGQDVDGAYSQGDLYSESSIIIAHQAWLQRNLTETEISNYDGYIEPEDNLFFATQIISDSVIDISGNNNNGSNGNSPVYYKDRP